MFNTFQINNSRKETNNHEPVDLIPDTFTGLIVGKSSQGKSTLIQNMLLNEEALYKKFDLVLFMAPYEIADLNIPEHRMINSLNIPWVTETIEREKDFRTISRVLVIIDDLVSSINKDDKNQEVINFFLNRRKMVEGVNIDILCTTQKYTLFPAKFRSNLQFLIFFAIPATDLKLIIQEQIYTPPPHLQIVLNSHFRKSYNFIFVKLDKFAVFLNFEKQI